MKYKTPTINSIFTFDRSIWLLITIFFLLFSFVGICRHNSFLTSINDMGHFDQAVWSASNYGALLNSDIFNYRINRLGVHFDPILYLFYPFYKIKPTVLWLILTQAACASFSAWPIYLFAKKQVLSNKAGFFWALIYLLNPFLQNAISWDFHPVVIALPFISLSIYFLYEKNFFGVLICSIFIMMCKEHFGLMVAGFGFLWVTRYRDIGKSLLLVILGAIQFLLVFKYIMPYFSPTGEHLMLSKNMGQLSRYSWLGASAKEIILSLIKHPFIVLRIALFEMDGISYLILLLIPFLGFSLLGLPLLIPAVADLTANLLSANEMPRSIFSYHSVTLIPLLCFAAIQGSKKATIYLKGFSVENLAGFILLASLYTSYLFSPFPIPKSVNYWSPTKINFFQDPLLQKILFIIGPSASVSAQANIGAHLSQRNWIFSFPNKVGDVDFIVLRLDTPTTNMKLKDPTDTGTLAHHLQMNPILYLDSILKLLSEKQYGIIFWEEPWLVFKSNEKDICHRKLIKERVMYLKEVWIK